MLKYRLQAIIKNKKDVSYRIIFERYLNSKTVNLECLQLDFVLRNKITREIISIAENMNYFFINFKHKPETKK